MQRWTAQRVKRLHHLCGYILCAKSPSCGLEQLYQPNTNDNRKVGSGLFTRFLQQEMPWLPLEEDGRLHNEANREHFIGRIYALYEFNTLWRSGLTRQKLMAFHSRYKLLLLSHAQEEYREMGRFVASMERWGSLDDYAYEYRIHLMHLMSHQASRRNHTNVLIHVQGYFRPQLSSPQRQELAQLIDCYRRGVQPLLAPIVMLKHYHGGISSSMAGTAALF